MAKSWGKLLSKIFGKVAKPEKVQALSETPAFAQPSLPPGKLVYTNESVGLHYAEPGETDWLPWCLFQNVQVVTKEPYTPGNYSYDIMAEFHHMDISWEDDGFETFLEAMRVNLDNFNTEQAKHAINGRCPESPFATIYISPHYPEDVTSR